MQVICLFIFAILAGCAGLEKDNKPKDPISGPTQTVVDRRDVYNDAMKMAQDGHGLLAMGDSIGDSALFSCIAYAAGAIDFDPGVLFTSEGKPLRHPEISPAASKSPISKDMVNGIMWCLYTLAKSNPSYAQGLTVKMIDYGRNNRVAGVWSFCSKEDVEAYKMDEETFVGRCLITPSVAKDIYRVAIFTGWQCDTLCQTTMATGVNLPTIREGFSRHLAVLTTVRNGLIEGAINDNSLNQLKEISSRGPNNALFQAAYTLFSNGDFSRSYELLDDETKFPLDAPPTSDNYCTDYLYQRDEIREEILFPQDGCISYHDSKSKEKITKCELPDGEVTVEVYNDDWLPCPEEEEQHLGVDWRFAEALASGLIHK
jgi:hypothetical protein